MSRALDNLRAALLESKQRLRIPELWKRLGHPGEATGDMVCCPFHKEKTPSFHIFDEGRMFKCFGCGKAGDAVTFLEFSSNLSKKDVIHKFVELAGCQSATAQRADKPYVPPPAKPQKPRSRPELPEKHPGTPEQRAQLAKLRNLSISAIDYAVELGLLSFVNYRGVDAWMIADVNGVSAQVRRMDGQLWGETKAFTLPASWARWPIGIPAKTKRIIFAEGGPDFLAACQLCAEDATLSPACLFGAAMKIHPGAVPLFHACDVYIVPHRDDAGAVANMNWTEQLKSVANSVTTAFLPEHEKVNDLNDLLALPADVRPKWDVHF